MKRNAGGAAQLIDRASDGVGDLVGDVLQEGGSGIEAEKISNVLRGIFSEFVGEVCRLVAREGDAAAGGTMGARHVAERSSALTRLDADHEG